jgi:hypothetical protein
MPDLVSKAELASILSVSGKTVQRLTSEGKLHVVERKGQTPYYDRDSSIEIYHKHAEEAEEALHNPGGDVLAESRLARVESHYRRQVQKLAALLRESLEYDKAVEAWGIFRNEAREICLSCVDNPPFTAGLTRPLLIGLLLIDWQHDLLTRLLDGPRIDRQPEPPAINHDHLVGSPEDIFEKIEAMRARVNYCIADHNNVLADLVGGKAVKASLFEEAVTRRVMSHKARIESISQRLAPQLVGLSQAKSKEFLLELVNESLEELTDLSPGELFDKAVLDLTPEKPIEETEVNGD